MSEEAPKILRLLKCETHGDRRWKGHIMCDACGLVFQTESDALPRAARDVCPCGRRLMPANPSGDALGMVSGGHPSALPTSPDMKPVELAEYSDDFTARPICYLCYRLITQNHKGRVPGWVPKEQRS